MAVWQWLTGPSPSTSSVIFGFPLAVLFIRLFFLSSWPAICDHSLLERIILGLTPILRQALAKT